MSNNKLTKDPDFLTQNAQAEAIIMTTDPSIARDEEPAVSKTAIQEAQAKHKISKKFGSHLDALFRDSGMAETAEAEPAKDESRTNSRVKKVLPRMGLDTLIRNTRHASPENSGQTDELKRVTFIYSRRQLEKIRLISKLESRYMKDIIGEAVNQWIDKYERKLLKKQAKGL